MSGVEDRPSVWPAARGVETTTYAYATKETSGGAPPTVTVSSVARLYHDCGSEWVATNEVEHADGCAYMRYRCAGCRAFGRHLTRFPVEKSG